MTEQEWLEIFSDNLSELIKERGYNLQDLADDCGLTRRAITYYLHKERMPGIRAITKLAYALDCDILDLVDFGDNFD